VSTDVVEEDACDRLAEEVARRFGRVHLLILSAGISEPGEFLKTSKKTWERVMNINVLGCRNVIKSLLPLLAASGGESKQGARVIFVSSGAGLTGLYGFSAYSSSKFALLGLAQVLQQELHTINVRVGLHFPPDTDTPLLRSENEQKPELTKILSGAISVVQPGELARTLIRDACRGMFLSAHDMISWLLVIQTSGMSPAPTVREAAWQVLLQGFPLRLVAISTVAEWMGVIRAHAKTHAIPALFSSPESSKLAHLAAESGHPFPTAVQTECENAVVPEASTAAAAASGEYVSLPEDTAGVRSASASRRKRSSE
jgi:3-dehydrosphinganine reductase